MQVIDEIYDNNLAKMGFKKGNIVVMIHSGSRAFGHQVASDYVNIFSKLEKYNLNFPDKQLVCVPIKAKKVRVFV